MQREARVRRRLRLRDLDTLLAVAQRGSMAKAATQLSVSQPAVSKAMAEIEHTLGVRLLDRTAQGVEPTLYGRALIKCATAVFDEVRQGVKEIEFLADPNIGELRIGASEPIISGFLPEVMRRISGRHPGIMFDVSQVLVDAAGPELRERRVDLVVGRLLATGTDDLKAEVLFNDPLCLAVGVDNPLTRKRKVRLEDLMDHPWVLPRPESAVGGLIAQAFRGWGVDVPRPRVICNSFQMYNALLSTEPFLAVYPRSLLWFAGKRLGMKMLPVDLPPHPAPVGILALRNRTISPVAGLFIEVAREIAKPLARLG